MSGHRILVVGSGTRFLSGISFYTHRLATALSEREHVAVVLMRRLLPRRLYPGRDRVDAALTNVRYPERVAVFDGVDWYWVPSLLKALWFVRRERPTHVVMQWWTGTVLHSYVVLAVAARLLGARVIVEFHEVLDTGELRIPGVKAYVSALSRLLLRFVDGFVVHSEFDRAALAAAYPIAGRPVGVIPLGPFDHLRPAALGGDPAAEAGPCRLLFFGTIRPYKGVEDLVQAFERLADANPERFTLTVVGETWEGWTRPNELIALSPHRDRITLVNRYVTDDEAAAHFETADVVVLPYHRSSASGPLHIAMARGLPTVVTSVGGLGEAAGDYAGAVFAPARDPEGLAAAIDVAAGLRGQRFDDPHTWDRTCDRYEELFAAVSAARSR